MLHLTTVHHDTLALLKTLQTIPELSQARRVGGTALALHLGHRMSIDLDVFGDIDGGSRSLQIAFTKQKLSFITVHTSANIYQYLIRAVQVDVVNYPYPWLVDPIVSDGITLAGLQDIAAMKLSAITNRGTKKDFVDFFFLLNIFSLDEMLTFYKDKYSSGSIFNVVQSLSYFDDAEAEPLPKMLKPFDWTQTKTQSSRPSSSFLKRSNRDLRTKKIWV